MRTVKTVPLAIAVVAMLVGVSAVAFCSGAKATSEESHLVLNYIQANSLPVSWENKFHAINSDWPPSRNALAGLLLDAQVAVVQRSASLKDGT